MLVAQHLSCDQPHSQRPTLITFVGKTFFLRSLKSKVILIAVTLLDLNVATRLPVTQLCYGEGIESKNYICNKKKQYKR